jgi:uroporphyrin-III C-methyltransferase
VVYDNLVGPDILKLAPTTAEKIYVGKKAANHALPQPQINQLLIDLASQGKYVVRLKGGDPFIFGRGGEEAEALVGAGVTFEVVPGITAASGISAYAGIPLTHRDFAQSCMFVTGHLKDHSVNLNWAAIAANPRQTLVFYMGISQLGEICRQLVHHGLAADTPACVVRRGTLPDQHVVNATLATLPQAAEAAGIHPPALVIIGQVVQLQTQLAWFQPGHPQ